jgi:hypothetical protein
VSHDWQGRVRGARSAATPDLKIKFYSVATDASANIGYIAALDTAVQKSQHLALSTASGQIDIGSDPSNPVVIQVSGTIRTGASVEEYRFQWAQNTSNAAAVTIMRGSFLRADEIP